MVQNFHHLGLGGPVDPRCDFGGENGPRRIFFPPAKKCIKIMNLHGSYIKHIKTVRKCRVKNFFGGPVDPPPVARGLKDIRRISHPAKENRRINGLKIF